VKQALRLGNEEGKIVWWWPMLTMLASKSRSPGDRAQAPL